jgi:hypothetical protein
VQFSLFQDLFDSGIQAIRGTLMAVDGLSQLCADKGGSDESEDFAEH